MFNSGIRNVVTGMANAGLATPLKSTRKGTILETALTEPLNSATGRSITAHRRLPTATPVPFH